MADPEFNETESDTVVTVVNTPAPEAAPAERVESEAWQSAMEAMRLEFQSKLELERVEWMKSTSELRTAMETTTAENLKLAAENLELKEALAESENELDALETLGTEEDQTDTPSEQTEPNENQNLETGEEPEIQAEGRPETSDQVSEEPPEERPSEAARRKRRRLIL
jgi:hypothetical protein